MNRKAWIVALVAALLAGMVGLKLGNEKPRTITREKVVIKRVVDTIEKVVIGVPDTVYIKTPVPKMKPLGPYLGDPPAVKPLGPAMDSVKVQVYPASLKANNATASLSIMTTGQLLGVQGTIDYQEKTRTIETTHYIQNSSLFLYGEAAVWPAFKNYELGLDYVIKDRIIVGASGGYDNNLQAGVVNVKFGVKIF